MVFEIESRPDEHNRQRFALHWCGVFFRGSCGHRSQQYYAEVEPLRARFVSEGWNVLVHVASAPR